MLESRLFRTPELSNLGIMLQDFRQVSEHKIFVPGGRIHSLGSIVLNPFDGSEMPIEKNGYQGSKQENSTNRELLQQPDEHLNQYKDSN